MHCQKKKSAFDCVAIEPSTRNSLELRIASALVHCARCTLTLLPAILFQELQLHRILEQSLFLALTRCVLAWIAPWPVFQPSMLLAVLFFVGRFLITQLKCEFPLAPRAPLFHVRIVPFLGQAVSSREYPSARICATFCWPGRRRRAKRR